MSDFPGKIVEFPPPPFFFGKKFFFEFSEKCSKFFFNEIDCKKCSKFFSMNSAVKIFKNFLQSISLKKNFKNFLQSISLKKNFEHFSENSKKKFCPPKKVGSQGGNSTIFPRKSDMTFCWVLTFSALRPSKTKGYSFLKGSTFSDIP